MGVVINSKTTVDKAFLDKAKQLAFVARLGSGLEIVDLEYAAQQNVQVYNSPDGNCDAVAEHAIAMLFAWANNLALGQQTVATDVWDREVIEVGN